MKLKDLIKDIKVETIKGKDDVEILNITDKSNEVDEFSAYVAIKGLNVDGHKFLQEVVSKGCKLVFVNHIVDVPSGVTQVVLRDTRKEVGQIASNFFERPTEKMKVIGVTGTNGKTTTTYMLQHILETDEKKVGLIGTNGIWFNGKHYPSTMTTPDPIDLQKWFFNMQKSGVEFVVMEVSAHALALHKMNGTKVDVAIFTNLTQDHLDFFKTMENYGEAKAKFFTKAHAKTALVCTDDKFGRTLFENSKIPIKTFGTIDERATFFAINFKTKGTGQSFFVKIDGRIEHFSIQMPGRFNALNALAAIGTSNILGLHTEKIKKALQTMKPVAGRFNMVDLKGHGAAIVDYAHTPDGLENVLKAAKEIACERRGRLISVFGCGGNRDTTKRPIMGKISETYADLTIVTSDNPRFEKPEEIVSNILSGMTFPTHFAVVDRESAIKRAIELSGENDVVLISGKGAEDYIDQGGEKTHYTDFEAIEKAIEGIKEKN